MLNEEVITEKIKSCEIRKNQLNNKGNVCGIKDSKCLGYYTKNMKYAVKECKLCSEFFKDYKYSDEKI